MGRRLQNLIGKKFGRLRAIHPDRINGIVQWLCECECGKLIYVKTGLLTSGRVKSCGCSGYKFSPEVRKKLQQNAKHARACIRYKDTAVAAIIGSTKRKKKNISGVTGVYWNKGVQKWYAMISLHNKNHFLGYFDSVAEAAEARADAEKKYYWPVLRKYKREKEAFEKENHERWLASKEAREKELEQYRKNVNALKTANKVRALKRAEKREKEIDEQLRENGQESHL